jgi:hypothetical protein
VNFFGRSADFVAQFFKHEHKNARFTMFWYIMVNLASDWAGDSPRIFFILNKNKNLV